MMGIGQKSRRHIYGEKTDNFGLLETDKMDDHAAGAERPDSWSGGPDGAAGGAGEADRLGERLTDDPDPATKYR